jgi:hypothetical protein
MPIADDEIRDVTIWADGECLIGKTMKYSEYKALVVEKYGVVKMFADFYWWGANLDSGPMALGDIKVQVRRLF